MGFDLNRHWLDPSPWAHPTLYATKNLLMEYDRNEKVDLGEDNRIIYRPEIQSCQITFSIVGLSSKWGWDGGY